MLYFLYGNDFKKARANLKKIVSSLRSKKPDAEYFVLDGENWSDSRFEELLGSQGLFEKKYIVLLDSVVADSRVKDVVFENIDDIQKSESIFVWFEPKIDKASLAKIEKKSEKVQDFILTVDQDKKYLVKTEDGVDKTFNMFSLTDALGERNKKDLWVLYNKAVMAGAPPEEIHGILFWQVKSMLLASLVKNAEDAGMKPYPFSKSKTFAKNYKNEELVRMSSELVHMVHDAHRGLADFSNTLERWVLRI